MSKELVELNKRFKKQITITTTTQCQHENGWFGTVWFWVFKKRIFCCTDCGAFIDAEES